MLKLTTNDEKRMRTMNLIRCWPDSSLFHEVSESTGFSRALNCQVSCAVLEPVGVAPYEGDFPAIKRGVVPPDAFILDPRESPVFNEVPGCFCTTDVTEDSKFDFFSSIIIRWLFRLFFFLANSMMIITHTNPMIKDTINTTKDRMNWRGKK